MILTVSLYLPFAAVGVSAAAAVWDWKTGSIPNGLTLGALIAAPFTHLAIGWSQMNLQAGLYRGCFSLLGALLCALIPLLLYRLSAMGGGDVKLLAAIGALCLPMMGIEAELYGFVLAVLIAP